MMPPDGGRQPDEPAAAGGAAGVGALADEAAQLLDALAARLAQFRVAVGDPATAVGDQATGVGDPATGVGDPATGVGDPATGVEDQATAVGDQATGAEPGPVHQQCVGWCPVCRSADLLRGERPEVAGRLVDSAIVVVGALRSLLPAVPAADVDPATGATPGPEAPGDTRPRPGIERIDIR